MEFPSNWRVDDLGDFDAAVATLASSGDDVAIELLALAQAQRLDSQQFLVRRQRAPYTGSRAGV
jgi:hypothetical protein